MSHLYYIRHGQSKPNLDKVFAGSKVDEGLTVLGESQAKEAAADITEKDVSFDRVFVSPLIRAQQTAQIVLGILDYRGKVVTDERLTEYDMGARSGTSNIMPVSGTELTSGEEAEDPDDFQSRVLGFINESRDLEGNTLVIGHSFVYRMIETINANTDPRLFSELPAPNNGELLKIDI